MSKDQVWKIISFFHTKRPKKIFPSFSRLKNYQFFPYFSRLRRNPAFRAVRIHLLPVVSNMTSLTQDVKSSRSTPHRQTRPGAGKLLSTGPHCSVNN